MPTVHWFRRDLRLADNPALLAALAAAHSSGDGRVVPLFVLDPALWDRAGEVRRGALREALHSLDQSLGGSLLIRHGRPEDVVSAVAEAAGAHEVHVTGDYAPYGSSRDARVGERLAAAGRELVVTGSPYAVAPGRVRKGDGTPYRVFTPFYRAWCTHGWRAPADDCPADASWFSPLANEGIPAGPAPAHDLVPHTSESAAIERWDRFRDASLGDYSDLRNRPDRDGTSLLSAALKWGVVHPRTLLADLDDSDGAEVFRREIAWREFYADVLHHNPHTTHTSLDRRFASMVYDEGALARERFVAWCEGRTGYPFVDAGMRQLRAEGWMHNRVRMIVASFLVKDLHLPWWDGARWFMEHLVDGDVASNTHGWQWTAGCGTDASPYFRIFNPVTQGLRFDPEGAYVRRYVPELAHLPGKSAHEPWAHSGGFDHGYPQRIVDHAVERDEALARFAALAPST